MKKLFSLGIIFLTIIMIFLSCSKDDEIVQPPFTEVEITEATVEQISVTPEILKVKVLATVVGTNIQNVKFMLIPNGSPKILEKNEDSYSLQYTIYRDDYPDLSEITGRVSASQQKPDGSYNIDYKTTNSIDFKWPTNLATIKINSVEQIALSGNELSLKTLFSNNSEQGELKVKLLYGGDMIGEEVKNFIATNSGIPNGNVISNYTHNEIMGGRTYNVLIENTDTQNPSHTFLNSNNEVIVDSNGDPVKSFTLEVTTVSNTVVISPTSINFTDVTPTSITSNLNVNVNTAGETIHIKVFNANDLSNAVKTAEYTTIVGDQTITNQFNDLTNATNYVFRYYHGDNTEHFFEANKSTNTSVFNSEIESYTTTVNNVSAVIEYDNTTGENKTGTVEFSGVDYNGVSHTVTKPITLEAGNVDTDLTFTAEGFKQNSSVTIQVIINGAVIAQENNISTEAMTYTNIEVSGGATTTSNQDNVNVLTFKVTANGNGKIDLFKFIHTMTNSNLNVNNYNNSIRINNSNAVVTNWTDGPNWKYNFDHTENITPGVNTFTIYLGNETYTPSGGAGTTDIGNLSLTLVDDNNVEIIGNTNVTVSYQ